MNLAHITDLMAFNANVQLAHWQADTRTSDHVTLGKLYEAMTGLMDELAEVALGQDRTQTFRGMQLTLMPGVAYPELLDLGNAVLASIRGDSKDDGILNLIADMQNELNRTRYLLRV